MMRTKYDVEIATVEARLIHERDALAHEAQRLGHTATCMAASPKGLMIAAVIGFLVGELTRPRRRRVDHAQSYTAPRAVGVGGVLGAVALALIRAQFGSPLGMGKAAVAYAAARSRARAAARTAAEHAPSAAERADSLPGTGSYPAQTAP